MDISTEIESPECGMTSLPCGDTVPLATPFSTGKRGIVPKRRFQTGTFVKRGENWIGMWRIDVTQSDGSIKREQRSKTFVGMSERAARAAFQPILDAVNKAGGAVALFLQMQQL